MARLPLSPRDPFSGYNTVSILLHWLTAALVVALYLTHERETEKIHLALGLVAIPFFGVRIWRRFGRGYPRVPDQPVVLNFLSRLVTLGFMLCILAVMLTGIAIPPLKGEPLAFLDLASISIPVAPDRALAHLLEEIHEVAGNAFLPLVALHIAGALKHALFDRDTVLMRILRPIPGGK